MKKYIAIFLLLSMTLIVYADTEELLTVLMNAGFGVADEMFDPPGVELENLEGKIITLDEYKGKVVLLNFWATWCPPCRQEMPSMQKLYDKYKKNGLEILAVDLREGKKTVEKFMDKYEYTFPALLDKKGIAGSLFEARNIPTTFVITREGKIIARIIGAADWESKEIIEAIEKLLDA